MSEHGESKSLWEVLKDLTHPWEFHPNGYATVEAWVEEALIREWVAGYNDCWRIHVDQEPRDQKTVRKFAKRSARRTLNGEDAMSEHGDIPAASKPEPREARLTPEWLRFRGLIVWLHAVANTEKPEGAQQLRSWADRLEALPAEIERALYEAAKAGRMRLSGDNVWKAGHRAADAVWPDPTPERGDGE